MPESPLSRERKIQLLQAIEEKKRRRKAAPLFYTVPHAKQAEYLDLYDRVRIAILSGGNRVGKTFVAAIVIVSYLYGYWIHKAFADGAIELTAEGDYPPREHVPPKYWIRRTDGIPLREQRSVLAVTGLTLTKGIHMILWPEIEAALPLAMRSRIHVVRGVQGVPVRVAHPDGSWVLHFGSIEQGSMVYEGQKHDYVHFDEPPSRSVFTAVWRGCIDYLASVGFTFTPLGTNAPWLYEEFFTSDRTDVGIVTAAQSENPHVTKEALEQFEAGVSFSEEELLSRKTGAFGFLTHRAFQGYDSAVHLIEPFSIPKSWPRICACDPASRRPFYFLWLAYDEVNKAWIAYREFPYDRVHHQYRTSDWTVQDYVTILRNLEGEEQIDRRVIDPRYGVAEYHVKGEKQTSVCDDFRRYGMRFDPRVPDTGREETGIQRIRELLYYDKSLPVSAFNRPHLFVFNTLLSLPHALENYSFIPPNARDDRILSEKLHEFAKDPIDALRYGILTGRPTRLTSEACHYISQRDFEMENQRDESWL